MYILDTDTHRHNHPAVDVQTHDSVIHATVATMD